MVVPTAKPSLFTKKYWKVRSDVNDHAKSTCPVTSLVRFTVKSVTGANGSPKIVIVTGTLNVPTSGSVVITISAWYTSPTAVPVASKFTPTFWLPPFPGTVPS